MKNREKFSDEILTAIKSGATCDFMKKMVIPEYIDSRESSDEFCTRNNCVGCANLFAFWLEAEYVEPPTDWVNVPVDTLVRVRDVESGEWLLRYFCEWNGDDMDRKYITFPNGMTSKTTTYYLENWRYCELVEDEDDEE